MGKAKSKTWVLRRFLKISVQVAEWTDSGRLFQKERATRAIRRPTESWICDTKNSSPLYRKSICLAGNYVRELSYREHFCRERHGVLRSIVWKKEWYWCLVLMLHHQPKKGNLLNWKLARHQPHRCSQDVEQSSLTKRIATGIDVNLRRDRVRFRKGRTSVLRTSVE